MSRAEPGKHAWIESSDVVSLFRALVWKIQLRAEVHEPIDANALWQQRAKVLQAAYAAHPERFKGKIPTPPELPKIVGINLPKTPSPETANALIQTPALLANLNTQVSHSH